MVRRPILGLLMIMMDFNTFSTNISTIQQSLQSFWPLQYSKSYDSMKTLCKRLRSYLRTIDQHYWQPPNPRHFPAHMMFQRMSASRLRSSNFLVKCTWLQGAAHLVVRAARHLGLSIECTLWVLNQANTPSPRGLPFVVRHPLSHVPETHVSNSLNCEGILFRP